MRTVSTTRRVLSYGKCKVILIASEARQHELEIFFTSLLTLPLPVTRTTCAWVVVAISSVLCGTTRRRKEKKKSLTRLKILHCCWIQPLVLRHDFLSYSRVVSSCLRWYTRIQWKGNLPSRSETFVSWDISLRWPFSCCWAVSRARAKAKNVKSLSVVERSRE